MYRYIQLFSSREGECIETKCVGCKINLNRYRIGGTQSFNCLKCVAIGHRADCVHFSLCVWYKRRFQLSYARFSLLEEEKRRQIDCLIELRVKSHGVIVCCKVYALFCSFCATWIGTLPMNFHTDITDVALKNEYWMDCNLPKSILIDH